MFVVTAQPMWTDGTIGGEDQAEVVTDSAAEIGEFIVGWARRLIGTPSTDSLGDNVVCDALDITLTVRPDAAEGDQ